jgi:hypothetical protein
VTRLVFALTIGALAASRAASRPLAVLLASVPALLLTRVVIVDRPELMGLVLFAALLVLLRLVRDGAGAPDMIAIVLLMAAWTNVHGSFALGAVLVVLVCAEAAWRDPAQRVRFAVLASGALAVTLANPAGLGAWTAPGSHLLSPPREIQEWNVVDVRTPLGVLYVATLALVIACAFTGGRVPFREALLLAPIVFLSLTAARQTPLLAIAAAPLFAERLELLLDRLRLARAQRSRVPAAFVAVPLLVATLALVVAPLGPDERAYPVAARASIPLGDAVLARYEWGGWLIWSGVPVFVDGRLTPYRGAVLDDYRRIIAAAPGWRDAIARRGVRLLLVAASDPVAIRAAELGWKAQFRSADGNEVIAIAVP